MIFNIQRFSTHDGQGIRTMVFFKGCPLRCLWCSNPESQSFVPELMYDAGRCQGFGDCLKFDEPIFTPANPVISQTGQSATSKSQVRISNSHSVFYDLSKYRDICASRALTVTGEEKSADEIVEIIEKDSQFYSNGGGVTLSGGEPLSQGENLTILLTTLKRKKYNVAVETSLHVKWHEIERCIGLVDTFLADLKHTDQKKFNEFTGGSAKLVKRNLRKFAAYDVNLIIRIPVIPSFNHTMPEMKGILDFVNSLNYVREIHFLPYHSFGSEKYVMMGKEIPLVDKKPVKESELNEYIDYAATLGFSAKIGG